MWKNLCLLAVGTLLIVGTLGTIAWAQPPWSEDLIYDEEARAEVVVDCRKYKKSPPWTIGFSNADMGDPWRVFFWDQIQWMAKRYPQIEKVYHTNANNSPSKQLADVEDLLAKGIDLLLISACTESAGLSAIKTAYERGIPVVCADRGTASPYFATQVYTDQVFLGRLAASALCAELGGRGKIVILQGLAGCGPMRDRQKGFDDVLALFPQVEVLATRPCDWSTAKGKAAMEDLLVRHAEINGVLSQSGIMTVGAYEAVKEAGRLEDMRWGEVDCYNAWMKLLYQGKLKTGVGAESTTYCGAQAIQACVKILEGKPVPGHVLTPTVVVTPQNVNDWVMPDAPDTYWINFLGRGYPEGKGPKWDEVVGDWYGAWVEKCKREGKELPGL
jgi:ribose transport system substrate-binding protein